jgi:uncharacterized protein (TIGR04141 family)
MDEHEIPSRSLTIYLGKENRKPTSLIKERDGVIEKKVPVGDRFTGQLFIKPPEGKAPKWADFFEPYVKPSEFGEVSSSSAVLLVPVYKRWAAVTFGQGRYLLSSEAFEDRFGLRVALNCIDEKRIKSIDKQSFDAIASHTLEQASQEANAGEFGFDIERDILRAVTGTPKHKDFGNRLTGMEALNAHVQIELNQLHELLERYHQKFFETSYQKNFQWVDQIREVTDLTLEAELNDVVVGMIRNLQFESCWLSVPDILDWSRVSGFRFSQAAKKPELYDVHLKRFVENLQKPADLTTTGLKNRAIYCMGDNDQIIRKWSVFNCLYAELDHKGESYVLNAGKWYILQKDFVKQIDASFGKVPKYSGSFLDYDHKNEGAYNEGLVASDRDRFCLMDKNLTYLGGAMEFCDVFSKNNELIHIKRYGGSATLSHLFYQGVVSAELFKMEPEYRQLIREKLPAAFRTFDAVAQPKFEQYHVVFGIISQSDKPLTMPFFSRVGVRHAVRRLQAFGYKVSLAKIGVTEERKKLLKYKPKKQTKK